MTQIVNTAAAVGDPTLGASTANVGDVAAAAQPQPSTPDTADYRLVIEDDQQAGCFVYKTVDWRTGQVVQQLPREQLLKLRETDDYAAGDVIKTEV